MTTTVRRSDLSAPGESFAFDTLGLSLDRAGQTARDILHRADRDHDGTLTEAEIDRVFSALDALDGARDHAVSMRDGAGTTFAGEVYDQIWYARLRSSLARLDAAPHSTSSASVDAAAPSRSTSSASVDAAAAPSRSTSSASVDAANASTPGDDPPLTTVDRVRLAMRALGNPHEIDLQLASDAADCGVPLGGFRQLPLDQNGWPRISWAARAVDTERDVATLAHRLETTRTVFADSSLLLAVTLREHPSAWTDRRSVRINTYHDGGLDNLGRWLQKSEFTDRLPQDVLRRWTALRQGTNAENPDRPVTMRPASIPARDQMLAYAAALAYHEQIFRGHVRAVFGADADRLLAEISPDARRAWIQATFGGPAGGGTPDAPRYDPVQRRFESNGEPTRAVSAFAGLERIREAARERGEPPSLDDIFTDPLLCRHRRFQRAMTTALEARMFDRAGLGTRDNPPHPSSLTEASE